MVRTAREPWFSNRNKQKLDASVCFQKVCNFWWWLRNQILWVFRDDETTLTAFNEVGYYGRWMCSFEMEFHSATVFLVVRKFVCSRNVYFLMNNKILKICGFIVQVMFKNFSNRCKAELAECVHCSIECDLLSLQYYSYNFLQHQHSKKYMKVWCLNKLTYFR